MNDYRAATWAAAATAILVLAATTVIPATVPILALAAGFTGLAFLHAVQRPRTEQIELVVSTGGLFSGGVPDVLRQALQRYPEMFGGGHDDSAAHDGCPDCHSACPCRQ